MKIFFKFPRNFLKLHYLECNYGYRGLIFEGAEIFPPERIKFEKSQYLLLLFEEKDPE